MELKKTSSGIVGLDELTGGGLPAGRTTVVCGGPGCGKTLLAATFLVNGAVEHGEAGVFVSFDERAADIGVNVASLGFDIPGLEEKGLVVVDHVHLDRHTFEEAGEYDLEGLFVRLSHSVSKVGAKRVVLDSIDSLFSGIPNAGIVRSELRRLLDWLKEHGLTTILTSERGESSLTRNGIEEYVSDCVIVLDHRVIEQVSTRRLRVVKYRGSTHGTNEYPFLIGNDGLVVLPVTSLGLSQVVSAERVPTGIPSLDAMFEGKGYFRGASILVSGAAGTGKTSVAAHFIEAATRRGERCVYFSFEESPSQLMRNMRSIGLAFDAGVKNGMVRFISARPSLQGLEPHLVSMLKEVDEFRPSVVVVDPLSALHVIGTQLQTQGMLLRLIDHLKTKGITALFPSIQVDESVGNLDVSSIMDTWIAIRNLRTNNEFVRQLYVVKSRGMAHSAQVKNMEITSSGVRLLDVPQPGLATTSVN